MLNVSTWTVHDSTFAIRRAQLSDVEQIVDLVNTAYSEEGYGYYRQESGKGAGSRIHSEILNTRLVKKDQYTFFVCAKEGSPRDSIVGTVYLEHSKDTPDRGEFCMYAVKKEYRKQFEVGPRLLTQVEREAREHRITTLTLDVVDAIGEHNQRPLIAHYQRNGYHFTGSKEVIAHPSLIQPITLLKMGKILDRFPN